MKMLKIYKIFLLLNIIIFAAFIIGCAGTAKKQPDFNFSKGSIRIDLINPDFDTSAIIKKQAESIRNVLRKKYSNNSKITILDSGVSTEADFRVKIFLDTFFFVSCEVQKLKLAKKDSILNKLQKKRDSLDAAFKPLTPQERVAGSIAASVFLTVLNGGLPHAVILGEGEPQQASMSMGDSYYIRKIKFKPKLTGRIEITGKTKLFWSKSFAIDDNYDRFVTYEEQTEMLIRLLIRNMRFYYNMPFFHEQDTK